MVLGEYVEGGQIELLLVVLMIAELTSKRKTNGKTMV